MFRLATLTGARIADFDLGVVSAGAGSAIGCATPYSMEIDGAQVVQFCVFDITHEELANWKQLNLSSWALGEDG